MTQWIVALDEARGSFAYGPFGDEEEAHAFAKFLTAEVDPAKAVRLSSPVRQLLSWYEHPGDPEKPYPDRWPPDPGDIWQDRNGDRWICCRRTGGKPYLVCLAFSRDDGAEEVWRLYGPMIRVTQHIAPNEEEPPF